MVYTMLFLCVLLMNYSCDEQKVKLTDVTKEIIRAFTDTYSSMYRGSYDEIIIHVENNNQNTHFYIRENDSNIFKLCGDNYRGHTHYLYPVYLFGDDNELFYYHSDVQKNIECKKIQDPKYMFMEYDPATWDFYINNDTTLYKMTPMNEDDTTSIQKIKRLFEQLRINGGKL